ncbi:MAG: DNA mismatch repair endonuclease MutL [Acidaminococcaceae bacterium]|nr:DNA mismatch repair endonuclease MutL [Acidaminococcaceae bacterium]
MIQEREVRLLDTNTSNQIAAGEVVEKPASVVKELVENALDAGADSIEVTIFEGGTEYIRVADNGCGMTEQNARMALQRHATSKIREVDDLRSLHTLGFRGEALPSIASVSRFELLTRPQQEELATSIKVNGGEVEECIQTGGPAGTTVIVKDLFYNVPARRKFLKTVSTEGRYITEMLTRIALARPDVRFKLTSNDKEVLVTPGLGNLKDTITALYGKKVSEDLLPVKLDGVFAGILVQGFIGKPTLLKGTRGWQTILVNGRSISNLMISKAIEHAYQSQIPKRGFAFAVLDIQVDPATIDVNVHPQKSEIKFSDESAIYKAVFRALTDALTKPMHAEQEKSLQEQNRQALAAVLERAENDSAAGQETGAVRNEPAGQQTIFGEIADTGRQGHLNRDFGEDINRYGHYENRETHFGNHRQSGAAFSHPRQEIWKRPDKAYGEESPKEPVYSLGETRQLLQDQAPLQTDNTVAMQLAGEDTLETIWPIGQVDKTFIIAQSEDTLYLIDQHAAHERILYDRLVLTHNDIPAQQLLIPLYVTLQPEDVELLEQHHDAFYKLGVDITTAGENSVRIASLPSDIRNEDAEDFIREIAQYLRDHRTPEASELRQDVLHMTACRAAIKAGEVLNMRQMRQLIIDLCNTTHPFTCPHGRPCMIAVTSDELYKLFKRTGFDLPGKNVPYDR